MNFLTKNRLLIGAVVLLAAINIAILATIGYHHLPQKDDSADQTERPDHSRMMARELELTPEQVIQFEELRKEYAEQNQLLRRELNERYRLIMTELSAPEPNNAFLDSVAKDIGKLHTDQQKATIQHFLELREICSLDQSKQLQRLFKRMMSNNQMNKRGMMQKRQRFERNRFNDSAKYNNSNANK
jgi:Spy/CpxP family protein refolding chaperone